jgi:hypothetical protein
MGLRTTVTLDDDVVAMLARLQEARPGSFKEVVNATLRKGAEAMMEPVTAREPFKTRVFNTGRSSIPNLDCVSEVLDWLDSQEQNDRAPK